MKVTAPSNLFKAAFQHVLGTGITRSKSPGSRQVMIEAHRSADTLSIVTCHKGYELAASFSIEEIEAPGIAYLPIQPIKALLNGAVQHPEITIDATGEQPVISTGNLSWEIDGEYGELRLLAAGASGERLIQIEDERWRKVLDSAATDDSRPVLATVRVYADEGRARLMAADGFRLAIYDAGEIDHELDAMIPTIALRQIPKGKPFWIRRGVIDEAIVLEYNKTNDVSVIATIETIDGTYPDLESIVPGPEVVEYRAMLRTADIVDAARIHKAAGSLAPLTISGDSMTFKTDHGTARWSGYDNPEKAIAFNPDYLAWAAEGTDQITIESKNENAATAIRQDDLTIVVMPMMIGGGY